MEPEMIARIQRMNTGSSQQALAAFVSKKADIDAMLTRLQALSDDHFNYGPDALTWAHVGTLEHYAELLNRVTDSASKEGECAEYRGASQEERRTILEAIASRSPPDQDRVGAP
jgi:hypothetical protein